LDHRQAGIAIANAPSGKLRYVNRAGLLIGGEAEAKLVASVDVDQYVASWKLPWLAKFVGAFGLGQMAKIMI